MFGEVARNVSPLGRVPARLLKLYRVFFWGRSDEPTLFVPALFNSLSLSLVLVFTLGRQWAREYNV